MKPVTANDYRTRIDRVLLHIAEHPDSDLSVAELARVANFSPFHFHRQFRAVTGESVAGLVRRLRLETAGRALRESDASVIEIAFAAGYGSPEAFSRAFQQAFGISPSDYRNAVVVPRYRPSLSLALRLERPALRLTLEPFEGGTEMEVTIETFPDRLAACLRHIGPYDELHPTYERLLGWAGRNRLLGPATFVMGLSYDNPESVAEEELRYDACVSLPQPMTLPDGFRLVTVRGGRYAVYLLKGPYSGIRDAFRTLFGKWLPTSGEEIDDRPCLELYLNSPVEVPDSALLTKVCIPLKD
jgi:AraC family transcriptional regulator